MQRWVKNQIDETIAMGDVGRRRTIAGSNHDPQELVRIGKDDRPPANQIDTAVAGVFTVGAQVSRPANVVTDDV